MSHESDYYHEEDMHRDMTALRAENARLREALERIACFDNDSYECTAWTLASIAHDTLRAVGGEEGG